jgi:S-adenosylmethionine-diacylglycerol 3-amino-3-carboxypropyl transferase
MFCRAHGGRLIDNARWEDPRLDRDCWTCGRQPRSHDHQRGLQCPEYLLDDPREIHAVDMNFRQNALLGSSAVLQACRFSDVFELFGTLATAGRSTADCAMD